MIMKGQLKFDDLGNIYAGYEESEQYHSQRVPMVDPCYYCLCNSCVNNAESITISPKELPDDWNPCFFCDICSNFDEKGFRNMEKSDCRRYVIDDYHVRKNRKKFRIVR